MAYETCADVSGEIWQDLQGRDPAEITSRVGVAYREGVYRLPFLDRELLVDPAQRRVWLVQAPAVEPGFRVCLISLQYLLRLDPAKLGAAISPLELAGGATFFRGQHGLPHAPLEARFGRDAAGFLAAGQKLLGEPRPAGDAAIMVQVFPGLLVEVILWQGDEEFPAQVSFAVPGHLDRCWSLDAVWGLLNLVVQELVQAASSEAEAEDWEKRHK